MSDKPAVFFYSGNSELLATKPVNVSAIDINNIGVKNNMLNEIGKNLDYVPCVFVRESRTWYDETYRKQYVLPEQWVPKNLSGVSDWRAVGLEPTVARVEPVVEVPEVVVEPVVEVPEVVVEPVVEVPEVVVEPVVEPVVEVPEVVVEPVVEVPEVVVEPVTE
jgi:hypothetical protein